ncbi:dickkopf-related protein 3-like [Paroedura picta]|uniref:dickkopf-related protein 3-like n=1 Tax=Paroedura picta TaxID=143630 RepID=UPI004057253F
MQSFDLVVAPSTPTDVSVAKEKPASYCSRLLLKTRTPAKLTSTKKVISVTCRKSSGLSRVFRSTSVHVEVPLVGDTAACSAADTEMASRTRDCPLDPVSDLAPLPGKACNSKPQSPFPHVCENDNDCQRDPFCFRSLLASRCQQCKAEDMTCLKDGECCLGYLCVWGKCAEGVSQGESGTRCDPNRDECASGLCCATSSSLSFPVCAPYPKEGEACQTPSTTFFGLMGWGNQAAFAKSGQYCPCAQGLQCRSKRYAVSTCEKPENSMEINSLSEQLPVLQPILLNRNKEEAYYGDSRPEGQLAIVSLPRGLYSMEDAELSEDYEEKRLSPWEERDDPNRSDFQELEQLADQMGQYFGPGFY